MLSFLKRHIKFFENFFSLSLLQGTQYFIPLIVFPYLTRILGIANYGVLALIQTVLMYFGMVIGYGFRLTSTDKIAKQVDQPKSVQSIFWNTIYTKLLLFMVCFILLICAAQVSIKIKDNFILFLSGFILLFGQLLIPDFFFLAKQKMKFITISTLIGKSIYAILIFLLVTEKNDILQAVIANGIGALVIGFISFYYALKELNYKIEFPNLLNIITELKEGLYVFFSQMSVSLYSTVNILLLAAFTDKTTVGYYSITEKIYKSLSSLVATPFNMAIFPKLSQWYIENKETYHQRVRQMMGILLCVFSLMAIGLFFLAEPIVQFLIKEPEEGEIETLTKLVKIVSLALVFNPFGAFFTQQFIIKDRRKTMLNIILLLGLINVLLVCIFIPNIYMIIWAVVINRVLAMILNGYFSMKEI